jgi:hypothetical protein
MSDYSLPDMWDIAADEETAIEVGHDDGLEYLLEVSSEDGLVGTSFSGLYIERGDDDSAYTVAMVDGTTDGLLTGGRAQGRVFEYETETTDPADLSAEVQEAYLETVTAETTAMFEAMLNTDAGIERDGLTSVDIDSFVATDREGFEQVYDEAF